METKTETQSVREHCPHWPMVAHCCYCGAAPNPAVFSVLMDHNDQDTLCKRDGRAEAHRVEVVNNARGG